jgi:nucleotide-binding universal stress UspA family protein
MKDIIVGVDSSSASERALDRALLEAERRRLPLRVVHAWTTPAWFSSGGLGYVPAVPSPEISGQVAQDLVDEVLAKGLSRRTSQVPVEVTAEVHEGDPARLLTGLSEHASLMVLGGNGHGQLASALLGSVTTFVLHHAGCPVMVVPSGAHVGPPARIVVGLDGSTSSRAALRWALAAAEPLHPPVVAVHAWQIHASAVPITYAKLPADATHQTEARSWLDAELSQAVQGADCSHVLRQAPYGLAAATLLEEARDEDLLVLGSRGRGGFSSLLLGSVATQCAAHARGTVVVVREGLPA